MYVEASNGSIKTEDFLKRVKYKRVLELPELIFTVYHMRKLISEADECNNSFKLVIIDSFCYFLRDQSPLEKLRIAYELINVLENTAMTYVSKNLLNEGISIKFSIPCRTVQLLSPLE